MNLALRVGYALLLFVVMCFVVPWRAVHAAWHTASVETLDGLSLILDIFLDYK